MESLVVKDPTQGAARSERRLMFFDHLVPSRYRGRRYWFWGAAGCVAAAAMSILYAVTGQSLFLTAGLPMAVASCAVPLCIHLCHMALLDWLQYSHQFVEASRAEFDSWSASIDRIIYRTKPFGVVGAAFVVWAFSAYWSGGFFDDLRLWVAVVLGLAIATSSFAAGVGLASLFCLARIVFSLGVFRIRLEFQRLGASTVGQLVVKGYLSGAAIWLVITASIADRLVLSWATFLTISMPTILFVAVSFFICQLPVHRRLIETKRHALIRLQDAMARLDDWTPEQLDEERRGAIAFLEERIGQVVALPEWPVSWRSTVGVSASWALSTVLPALLQLGAQEL